MFHTRDNIYGDVEPDCVVGIDRDIYSHKYIVKYNCFIEKFCLFSYDNKLSTLIYQSWTPQCRTEKAYIVSIMPQKLNVANITIATYDNKTILQGTELQERQGVCIVPSHFILQQFS